MYGNWAEVWAGMTGQPIETTPTMGTHYLCTACDVHGVVREEVAACWCCGTEELVLRRGPSLTNASYSPQYEEVAA